MLRNARFWTMHNGSWVKVTVPHGKELTAKSYRPTDEGYTARVVVFTNNGQDARIETIDACRDCDGRYEYYDEMSCPIDLLRTIRDPEITDLQFSPWKRGDHSQRDYSAEAMNY